MWDHLCPSNSGMTFLTRMGPSVPKIFRGDFLAKLDHMCPKRKISPRSNYYCAWRGYFVNLLLSPVFSIVCFSLYIFSFDFFFFACLSVFTQVGPSVPKIFRDNFFTQVGPSVPKIFRDEFLREWDHLCPGYLGVMFYPSGTICAQNVRFYIEATIIVHGEIMLPVCCFPPFSQLFAFAYIYIYIYIYGRKKQINYKFIPTSLFRGRPLIRGFNENKLYHRLYTI